MSKIPQAVRAYYTSVPESHQATMFVMRDRILEVAPTAREIIKYAMPTFVVDGVAIAGLKWNKSHIGYYPYSGSVLDQLPEISAKYVTTKGALHVPLGKPLLKNEVKELIKTRLALAKGK